MTELNQALVDILVCPNCQATLVVDYEASELVCSNPEDGLAFPVRDSIPILLIDEARRPGIPTADQVELEADEITRHVDAGDDSDQE